MNKLRIDLGCGSRKKEGTIGVDLYAQPGVDYVLNLQTDPLPFPDRSVEYVHSSHFLEHIENGDYVAKIFAEISRVCVDGAEVELWTPYLWSNSAFVFGHNVCFNEDHYFHPCVWHSDFWQNILQARWLLKEIRYVVGSDVLIELYRNKINIDFALKYYKGIASEFGVFIEVRHDYQGDSLEPIKTFALERHSNKYSVTSNSKAGWESNELENALEWFLLGKQEYASSQLQLQSEKQRHSHLQQPNNEMEQLQLQLQNTQIELQQTQDVIKAMHTSKFWKLRTAWFSFKNMVGLRTNDK